MIKQMGLDNFLRKRSVLIWCAWIGLCSQAAVYAQAAPFDEIKQTSYAKRTAPHSHTHSAGEIDENQAPVIVDVTYAFDLWRAARGGNARGNRYIDNLDVVTEADMERLIGWNGATVHVYGLYNNGRSLGQLLGDAQATSNIETGTKAVRLYEAWIDQKIGATTSVKVGLYDLNSEFDNLDSAGLFIGSAHGTGTDLSQSGLNGPSIFPSTSLGARIALRPAKNWVVRAAVLDGVPGDPARPKRTAIKLGNGDGALMIGELENSLGDGKLLFGHWRYTNAFDDFSGSRGHGNNGSYVRGEAYLTHERGDPQQGLAAFFRLGMADGRYNMFESFIGGGLNYTGLIKGRDNDQLGLGIAAALTSSRYRLANTSTKAEVALELTYRAQLTHWLTVQPNIQYVIGPNASPVLGNALAVGLRTELTYRISD